MIKLSDIIKSGGGNAKINRFINRYVLSKKEKKDIVNEIKTKGSSSGGSSIKYIPKYYSIEKSFPDGLKDFLSAFVSTIKEDYNGKMYISSVLSINDSSLTLIGFSFNPIYVELFGVNRYVDSIEDLCTFLEGDVDLILQNIKRITEEEYYKID